MGKDELSKAVTAEQIIAALRKDPPEDPLCWIMCYEDRPLQGRPQGGTQPHLMIFTTKAIGQAFIQGRSQYFAPEPLEVVPVDSPGTLSKLALAKADDSRYSAPPCGLLLNFSYSTGRADFEVAPETVEEEDIEDIVEGMGLEIPEETPEEAPEEEEAVEAKVEEPTHCPLCKKKLYMPHRGGISIGFGDAALEAMFEKPDLAHTAYACKKCGTRICQTCATKYVCPRCKNNTFDRFDLAALPPPPPLPAKTAKPKAAPAKKPKAAKPRAEPAVKAAATKAQVVETPVIKPIPALTATPRPATVPAPKPAARPAPKWWMIAAFAALALVILLLVINPWGTKTPDEKPVGLADIRTAAAMTAVAFQPATESSDSETANLTIIRGPNQWTITQVIFMDHLNIPGREKRSAPEGSEFLLVSFRCDTGRNPILVLDPGGPKAPLTLYKPEGIMGLSITDETGAKFPVQVVEVFDTADAPEGFFLLAIVPEAKDTYELHFLDSPALQLDPGLIPDQAEAPAEDPEQTEAPAPEPTPTEVVVIPTLPPFEPIALPGGEEFGQVVALSPKATYAASGNCRGVVRLWKGRTFIRDFTTGEADCVADITFTDDESLMAVSFTKLGAIFVFDVLLGDLKGQLIMPVVDEVEFSHQGNWLAAGSHGYGTALWDLTDSLEPQLTYRTQFIVEGNPDNSYTCLEFDPQDEFLAIGEGSGGVKVWDLKAGQVAHAIDAPCAAPRSMSFSLNRQYGGHLYFSDIQSQNVVNLSTGDINVVRTFPFQVDQASAFIPRIEFTALVKNDRGKSTIELWNNYHGELLKTLEGHNTRIFSIQFSQDGTLLLSGGYDFAYSSGEVFLWNTSEILP